MKKRRRVKTTVKKKKKKKKAGGEGEEGSVWHCSPLLIFKNNK